MQEGGCFCGAVRYRVEGAPRAVGICHCGTCRRVASGTSLPFATFEWARFAWLAGEPAVLHSLPAVRRRFCGQCGSPLTYENGADPGVLDIMVGSLDAPDALRPAFHVWMGEKVAWDVVADGLPGHARDEGTEGVALAGAPPLSWAD